MRPKKMPGELNPGFKEGRGGPLLSTLADRRGEGGGPPLGGIAKLTANAKNFPLFMQNLAPLFRAHFAPGELPATPIGRQLTRPLQGEHLSPKFPALLDAEGKPDFASPRGQTLNLILLPLPEVHGLAPLLKGQRTPQGPHPLSGGFTRWGGPLPRRRGLRVGAPLGGAPLFSGGGGGPSKGVLPKGVPLSEGGGFLFGGNIGRKNLGNPFF